MTEWQPIETAPKDGTWILGYHPKEWPIICWYMVCITDPMGNHYEHEAWHRMNGAGVSMFNSPTHWMPLPEPPSE